MALVVGGDVDDDGDERSLSVCLGDDARGVEPSRRLVLTRTLVPRVSADAAPTAVGAPLHAEAAAVRLVVVLFTRDEKQS